MIGGAIGERRLRVGLYVNRFCPIRGWFNRSSRRERFSPHDFRFDLGSFYGSGSSCKTR